MSVSTLNIYNGVLINSYSGTYDINILKYSDYYIEIKCTTNCSITVYQTNDTITPQPDIVTQYSYNQSDCKCITNTILCSNIKFSVTNLSTQTATLYFSVAYK